ncbi:MAG: NAD(P)-dependent oxidoreductase [Acidobacteria bacterium]|nr:NAD(P)-dependent oxidoreductase [Acidobacteriota bacterium]
MRILVTGAAGFIGSHVIRILVREGHDVYGLIRNHTSRERIADLLNAFRIISVDLRDSEGLRKAALDVRPECAIHLAWYAVPRRFWNAWENLDDLQISLSLVRALSEAGCKRLLGAGSCAEYDWDYGYLSEEFTPLRPRTLYGTCKNATRQVLEAFCHQVPMEFVWTRFFNIYGTGEAQEKLVSSVILALLRGRTANCTGGDQIRDFLHVEDLACAVSRVAQSNLTGSLNIGSGEPLTVRELVEHLGRILNAGDRLSFGALPADPFEPPVMLADVRKLKRHTGWAPAWKLEDGLRQVVSWWQHRIGN